MRRRAYKAAHVVLFTVAPVLYAVGAAFDHAANLIPVRNP